ncbi:hypothetical protein I7I48_03440 [Histoplasma ohiense]|nr:hypothetical protein I7I48_03440 [Histoplasma ohiense (nom. inval.)]
MVEDGQSLDFLPEPRQGSISELCSALACYLAFLKHTTNSLFMIFLIPFPVRLRIRVSVKV